jgi:hypothetical protein
MAVLRRTNENSEIITVDVEGFTLVSQKPGGVNKKVL